MGGRLLPAADQSQQETTNDSTSTGLQMAADYLSLLERSSALQQKKVPPATQRHRLTTGQTDLVILCAMQFAQAAFEANARKKLCVNNPPESLTKHP